MSINGNLEDLPFTDVIQLLHVARKSGTLRVESSLGDASIVCRDGDIVGATHPSKDINLGKILLEKKTITQEQLDEAIALMDERGPSRNPLMATLLELGHINQDAGWEGLRNLIHKTMAEIISWKEGNFYFSVNKIEIDDDFRHVPIDILEDGGGVDVKGALMEALRIFDEKNRDQQEREKKDRKEKERNAQRKKDRERLLSDDFEVPIREESEDTVTLRTTQFKEAVFLVSDGFIKHSMKSLCKEKRIFSYFSDVEKDILKEIEKCYEDGTDLVFIADLSASEESDTDLGPKSRISIIRRIKALRPELPMIILSKSYTALSQMHAFELRARTVIPLPSREITENASFVNEMKTVFSVILAALRSIFEESAELRRSVTDNRAQISSLRKRVNEIQDRKTSPDVSFVVLQYIAEYLERGIIFLVRKRELLGIGSFGVDSKGDTISAAAMRIKIPLEEPSIFRQVVKTGMVYKGPADDALLSTHIYSHIGSPVSNDVLLLPLKTENKTRAIVFGDFGRREAEPLKTDVFEILASQAGMAIEIALQRTRFSKIAPSPDYLEPEPSPSLCPVE